MHESKLSLLLHQQGPPFLVSLPLSASGALGGGGTLSGASYYIVVISLFQRMERTINKKVKLNEYITVLYEWQVGSFSHEEVKKINLVP